jgi:hypothetical protein
MVIMNNQYCTIPSPNISNTSSKKTTRHYCSFFVLLFVCCSFFIANAQTNIHGYVTNKDGKPLPNSNVLLLNAKDSVLIKGRLTNQAGAYSFENIPAGTYLISFSYTGLDQIYTSIFTITNHQDNLAMGSVLLDENSQQLKAVVVSARKPLYEQKIDRLVINVASSITSAGSTALDVLERSPGIMVDRINNNLSINGKSGVIVMMNGKRSYMDISSLVLFLQGIPSGNIERIEVITTPPANFDAEGSAGIINIVLKSKNQFGTNGSYSLSAGYDKGEQNTASININHRQGKFNVFGNYSVSRTRLKQLWTYYHAVTSAANLLENYSESDRHALTSQHDGVAGVDYEVGKKIIIGLLLTGSYRHWDMDASNHALVSTNAILDTAVKIANNELHVTSSYGINLNLQHNFKEEEKLTVNLDYLNYYDDNPNTYNNAYYDNKGDFLYDQHVKSSKVTPLIFGIAAIDYIKKLSKNASMETGIKASASRLNNDVLVATLNQTGWLQDSSLSGFHNLHESIGAVYASLNIAIDSNTSVKGGLRYEYTASNLGSLAQKNIIDRHYGNLFPSLFLLHTINKENAVNFSYSRRIWRPGFTDLAPWVIFFDPKTFQTGNPALQPAITDAINASYTYKNKILTISYSYTANPISMQPAVNDVNNKLITSMTNGKNHLNFSVNFSLPFTITKWWSMQNNIAGYRNQSNTFYKAPVKTESQSISLQSTQTFILPKDIAVELSGYYYSGGSWGLYKFGSMGSLDIGLQKKFIKQKSTLSCNVRNLLNTEISNYAAIVPAQNLVQRNKQIYGYTHYSISYTHSFGNDKVKQKRDRTTGAEDEKGRVN